jgi:SagB-type dehydrogenase family enzyme
MQSGPGPEFIEKTRTRYASPSQQSQGLPQPPLEIAPRAGLPVIDLPAPAGIQIPPLNLRQAIDQRRSSRRYSTQALSLEELSLLLWMTQGVKEVTQRPATQRTVPSAGARHAFETYLAVNRVEGLPSGLYRFLAIEHQLEEIERDPFFIDRLGETCWKQKQVLASGVTFVWAAVRERMYWRYGERGYRYLFLDAGHVCQNLYLAGEALHCGVCALGAFDDDAIDHLLGLDGEEQFVIYAASVGKKDPA